MELVTMKPVTRQRIVAATLVAISVVAALSCATSAEAQKKPNILFIMGDDIGFMQPGCYHQGLMVGETPNIDRLAREGFSEE